MKSINLNALQRINERVIRKAVRNKALYTGTIDGYTVAAIDGTNLFKTRKPACDDCIRRSGYGKAYYVHCCTVMSLIGESVNLVIDYEMIKHRKEVNDTGEGELIAAKTLLDTYGHIQEDNRKALSEMIANEFYSGSVKDENNALDNVISQIKRNPELQKRLLTALLA